LQKIEDVVRLGSEFDEGRISRLVPLKKRNFLIRERAISRLFN
jgi:hypothetical protein